MKTALITILLLTGIISTGITQNKTCIDYKTGKFTLSSQDQQLDFIIVRNDSVQTEINAQTGETSKFNIEWISECEMHLTMKESRLELMNFFGNRKLIVKIIQPLDDGYRFSAKLEGDDHIRYERVTVMK